VFRNKRNSFRGAMMEQSSVPGQIIVSTNPPFYNTFSAINRTNCAVSGLIRQFKNAGSILFYPAAIKETLRFIFISKCTNPLPG
jgi:hypothetical protein